MAGPQDVGQTYISVVALGDEDGAEAKGKSFNQSSSWSSSSSLAKDVFSITVRSVISVVCFSRNKVATILLVQ